MNVCLHRLRYFDTQEGEAARKAAARAVAKDLHAAREENARKMSMIEELRRGESTTSTSLELLRYTAPVVESCVEWSCCFTPLQVQRRIGHRHCVRP